MDKNPNDRILSEHSDTQDIWTRKWCWNQYFWVVESTTLFEFVANEQVFRKKTMRLYKGLEKS